MLREFVAALVKRRALPKDAASVLAAALATYRYEVGRTVQDGSAVAHGFLGVARERGYYSDALSQSAAATKAQHVALAVVLGGIEASMSRESWRSPDATAAVYLRQLVAWGYNLSEVEQIITDLDEKRRAQRDAANVADAAEEDTTEPATDTEEPELDTAAVENDPASADSDPAVEPEADPT